MAVDDHRRTLEPALEAETAALRQRLRLGLLLCLGPIVGFAIFDLYLAEPDRLLTYYGLKLVAVAIVLGAFLALGPQRSRGQLIAVGLASIATFYGLSSTSAILAREPLTTPLLTVSVALGTATLLPWGVLPQLAVVSIAVLSIVATVIGATGSVEPLLQYPTVGLAIGLGTSVYVAYEFDRSRRLLARRHAEQARAEREVRQLNELLEMRVAARTAELQRSEASLSALIENATDAIWSIDPSYRIIAFNTVTAQWFEAQFGEVLELGRDYGPRVREHFEANWKHDYDRGLAGERFSVQKTIEAPAGTRYYQVSFNPIVEAGSVTGLAIFSTDITERLRAEAAARQHQAELTHVLRLGTMGEMAGGLAHEINQPLAAIVNYAQGCARRLRAAPHDVAAVLPIVDDIAAEALRAGEIIRRLRSLVRKETPRQDWMDFNETVADAVRLLAPEARDHGVVIRIADGASGGVLIGDRIQMEQVIVNLLRNAIDALAAVRGRREITVATRTTEQAVELTVADSGPGLAPEIAEQIFDPFFSTKENGLGMGLSISRTIIESHQGRMWATNDPAGGAVFHVTLPLPQPVELARAM